MKKLEDITLDASCVIEKPINYNIYKSLTKIYKFYHFEDCIREDLKKVLYGKDDYLNILLLPEYLPMQEQYDIFEKVIRKHLKRYTWLVIHSDFLFILGGILLNLLALSILIYSLINITSGKLPLLYFSIYIFQAVALNIILSIAYPLINKKYVEKWRSKEIDIVKIVKLKDKEDVIKALSYSLLYCYVRDKEND
jgi:hypothetical protein